MVAFCATVRGRKVEPACAHIDVMPTLIDWMGLEVPRACDGRSLVPFLRGEMPKDWRTEVFWEHDFRDVVAQRPEMALGLASDECCYAVIRDAHYKYVHFAGLPPLLFDLRADPHETNSIAASRVISWVRPSAPRSFTMSPAASSTCQPT